MGKLQCYLLLGGVCKATACCLQQLARWWFQTRASKAWGTALTASIVPTGWLGLSSNSYKGTWLIFGTFPGITSSKIPALLKTRKRICSLPQYFKRWKRIEKEGEKWMGGEKKIKIKNPVDFQFCFISDINSGCILFQCPGLSHWATSPPGGNYYKMCF